MPRSPSGSGTESSSFRGDAGLSLAGAIFARGVIFVLQVCIARWLGVFELNLFVTASVVGATIYFASDLGLRSASLFLARGDHEICQSLVQQHRPLRNLSAVAGLAFGTAAVVILAKGSWQSVLPASMLIGSYVLQSYSRFLRAPLRAASLVGAEMRIETIEKASMLAGGILGLAFRSLELLAAGQLLGALLGLALTRSRLDSFHGRSIRLEGSVLKYGLTLASAVGAPMLYSRLDYLVLVRMGTPTEAAVYAAAYSILLGASLLPMALSEAAIAHLGAGRTGHRRYLRFAFAAGIAGAIPIALVGPVVVRRLFDFHNRRLGELFVVLALAFMVMTWNSSIGVLAPANGRQKLLLKIVASAAVVCLVLCILLVRRFGMIGAGLSTLLTEIYVGLVWLGFTLGRSAGTSDQPLSSGTPTVMLLP